MSDLGVLLVYLNRDADDEVIIRIFFLSYLGNEFLGHGNHVDCRRELARRQDVLEKMNYMLQSAAKSSLDRLIIVSTVVGSLSSGILSGLVEKSVLDHD